jgi:hypothetical protein
MTPAAPVTTATLPSRRIRSGMSVVSLGIALGLPGSPGFFHRRRFGRASFDPPTIPFAARADQYGGFEAAVRVPRAGSGSFEILSEERPASALSPPYSAC